MEDVAARNAGDRLDVGRHPHLPVQHLVLDARGVLGQGPHHGVAERVAAGSSQVVPASS